MSLSSPGTAHAHEAALGAPERRRVLANALIGSFVSSLSTSIVGVVLPGIGAWAEVGVLDVQWVMLCPLVVVSSVLLPLGRAGDLLGHRRLYVTGTAFLAAGGALCLLAPSFWLFLAGRGVQGFGSAMLMASSPALVSLAAEKGKRGRSLGFISTSLYLGLMLGPPLGGFLDSLGGFRLVFALQTVLPLALLLVSSRLLPDVRAPGQPLDASTRSFASRLDPLGASLLGASIVAALLAFTRIETWGGRTALLLCVPASILLLSFLLWERRNLEGLLDLRLFKDRTFSSACLGAFLNYMVITLATFLLPFYLEDILGKKSHEAGVYLMAMPLVMALVAGPSGSLSDRFGSRTLSSVGMLLSAFAVLSLTWVSPDGSQWPLVVGLALQGLGTGLFISPNTNSLMSSAPPGRQGVASGVMALARNLGMVMGTASSAAVYHFGRAHQLERGLAELPASMSGLHLSYALGAALALLAALVVLIRPSHAKETPSHAHNQGRT